MKKILIVDDDLYIRDLYQELLSTAGHEVTTAIDGAEGLEKISQGGFDLILLDVMMPKLDGLGILAELAQKPPKIKNGPIIILTNLVNDPEVVNALKNGATSYYIKSDHTPDEFIAMIEKYLV